MHALPPNQRGVEEALQFSASVIFSPRDYQDCPRGPEHVYSRPLVALKNDNYKFSTAGFYSVILHFALLGNAVTSDIRGPVGTVFKAWKKLLGSSWANAKPFY
jgi:hypothetical protein